MVRRFVRDFSPALSLRPNSLDSESILIALQLCKEAGSHLKVRSARVEELESFVETPLVAAHKESSNDEAGSVLGLDRLNEYTLMVVDGFFHKLIDLLRDLLSGIEQRLLLIILPVERQIEHSNCLPEVAKLCACRVDHSSHLVSDNKFQILNITVRLVSKPVQILNLGVCLIINIKVIKPNIIASAKGP